MSEFASAETNIPAPTIEEILQKYGHVDTAVIGEYVARFEGPLRPDTPEEAEMRAKAVEHAEHDFRILWELNTLRLAAEQAVRPEQHAQVIPIDRPRSRWLGRVVGGSERPSLQAL